MGYGGFSLNVLFARLLRRKGREANRHCLSGPNIY
jgi:hypothetical protein